MTDVAVHPSGIEGLGIFAARRFLAGERIRRISIVREVTPDTPLRPELGERWDHCDYPDGKTVLVGFPDRHVNHSCDPNAYTEYRGTDAFLVARREIPAGAEVTIDYNINITAGTAWPCHCGVSRCTGEVFGDFFLLPIERQVEYMPLLADWFVRRNRDRLAPLEPHRGAIGGFDMKNSQAMAKPLLNVYDDAERARAYAELEFPGTYYLAFRDIPALVRTHVRGTRALDFGCGTGRSTRFLRDLGLEVVGVDIAEAMLDQARAHDPRGDYRLVADGALTSLDARAFDLVLAAFTFDNIPTDSQRLAALNAIRHVLSARGTLIAVVSSPAIYRHEWASFSTRDFPANLLARDGDTVRIVMLDVLDQRPVEDVVCSDAHYHELFARSGLRIVETLQPLATGAEPIHWVSETAVAPWTIYVLGAG